MLVCFCVVNSRQHIPPPWTQLWLLGLLLAEMPCNRARTHSRVGSVGISVKKNNVLLALSSGLLHGLYKDRGELTENKEPEVVGTEHGGGRNRSAEIYDSC